jgi:hypothetical protein
VGADRCVSGQRISRLASFMERGTTSREGDKGAPLLPAYYRFALIAQFRECRDISHTAPEQLSAFASLARLRETSIGDLLRSRKQLDRSSCAETHSLDRTLSSPGLLTLIFKLGIGMMMG